MYLNQGISADALWDLDLQNFIWFSCREYNQP